MSYKQIPNLPPIIAASSDMLFEAAQGGSSGKVSLDVLFQFINDRIESYLVLPTRDLFVARIISGHYNGLSNGWVVEAGGYTYRRSIGATDINDMPDWVPSGTISINHFQPTSTPSMTDRGAALKAAIEYAATTGSPERQIEVTGNGEIIATSAMIVLDSLLSGIVLTGMQIMPIGAWTQTLGTLPAKLGGAICPAPLISLINSDKFTLDTVTLHCDWTSSGIQIEGCRNFRMTPNTFVYAMGDGGFGLRTKTKAGNMIIDGTRIQQFIYNDPGFDDQANRTAVGYVIDTADFVLSNAGANYCLCPFYKGPAYNGQVIGCHFFNGSVTVGATAATSYSMVIEGPEGLQITNLYNDKGYIYINADKLDSSNAAHMIMENIQHVTGSGEAVDYFIELYTTLADNDLAGLTIADNRFSIGLNNIIFSGPGTFSSKLKWSFISNQQSDGTVVTGVPNIFDMAGYLNATTSGVFTFGRFGPAELRAEQSITLNADYDANSSDADKYINFSIGGTVYDRITNSGYFRFGVGQGTGAGDVGQISWGAANQFRIMPSNATGTWPDYAAQIEHVPSTGWTFSDVLIAGNEFIAQDNLIQRATATATKSAAATLTAADLKTSAIVYTGAAANLTTPTGASLVSSFPKVTTSLGFEFYVVNTGSGAATLVAGDADVTFIGAVAVAVGTSATFFARKTNSGNAWQIIRRA